MLRLGCPREMHAMGYRAVKEHITGLKREASGLHKNSGEVGLAYLNNGRAAPQLARTK